MGTGRPDREVQIIPIYAKYCCPVYDLSKTNQSNFILLWWAAKNLPIRHQVIYMLLCLAIIIFVA